MAVPRHERLADEPLPAEEPPQVMQLTRIEFRSLFDEEVRSILGISGDEFINRMDAGTYDGIEEDEFGRRIVRLMMEAPFARDEPDEPSDG
jgi:hypothetical protein